MLKHLRLLTRAVRLFAVKTIARATTAAFASFTSGLYAEPGPSSDSGSQNGTPPPPPPPPPPMVDIPGIGLSPAP